jgi:hypothetical protein
MHGGAIASAHWSWPYMALRTSVFDEVFTYGIEAVWQTYFAHLGMTMAASVGEAVQPKLRVDVSGLWGSSG